MNENRPSVFTINDEMYYFADDIQAYFPDIFKGTGRCGVYDIITIEGIKRTEYIHADFVNDSWVVLLERTIYANLFLSKEWVEDFVKKNNITVCSYYNKLEVVLSDDEKITDKNGKPLEIHIVRDVEKKQIYFNMDDIINCNSEMQNYYNTITYYVTGKRRQYIYRRPAPNKPVVLSNYFTYYGILAFMTKGKSFPFLKRLDEWIHKIYFIKNSDLMYNPQSFSIGLSISAVTETMKDFPVIIEDNNDITLFDNDVKDEDIIQKTIVENETEDNSIFKCIIEWFEITFTTFYETLDIRDKYKPDAVYKGA